MLEDACVFPQPDISSHCNSFRTGIRCMPLEGPVASDSSQDRSTGAISS
jgi:hypothetical protein